MGKIDNFINTAPGQRFDPDGAYGAQCVDLIDQYCLDLFGDWYNTIGAGNAKDLFARANGAYFDKFVNNPNDPSYIPVRGDIVIWGAWNGNPYGHIAIVENSDANGMTIIEQNFSGRGTDPVTRRYCAGFLTAGINVMGWLRPKPERIINEAPVVETIPAGSRKTVIETNARTEPNTNSEVFQSVEADQVVAMCGYVENGEAVNGNTLWFKTARSGKFMTAEGFADKSTTGLDNLTPEAPKPEPAPKEDFSDIILDISNHQANDIINHFDKFAGVILKAGHVGKSFGGNEDKTDPKAKFFADKAREDNKMLGFYWLPYFENDNEMKEEAGRFVRTLHKLELKDNELIFVDIEPDFEGTKQQLEDFKKILSEEFKREVLVYAGNAMIAKLGLEKVDWYPNYSGKGNYAFNSEIHQFTGTGRLGDFSGNLDLSVSKISVQELREKYGKKHENHPNNEEITGVDNQKESKIDMSHNYKNEPKPELKEEDLRMIDELNKKAEDEVKTTEYEPTISKRAKDTVYFLSDIGSLTIALIATIACVLLPIYTKEVLAIGGGVITFLSGLKTVFKLSAKK